MARTILKDLPIIEDLSLSQQGDVLGGGFWGDAWRSTKRQFRDIGRGVIGAPEGFIKGYYRDARSLRRRIYSRLGWERML